MGSISYSLPSQPLLALLRRFTSSTSCLMFSVLLLLPGQLLFSQLRWLLLIGQPLFSLLRWFHCATFSVLISLPGQPFFSLLRWFPFLAFLSCSRHLANLSSLCLGISTVLALAQCCVACSCCRGNLSSLCSGVSRALILARRSLVSSGCLANLCSLCSIWSLIFFLWKRKYSYCLSITPDLKTGSTAQTNWRRLMRRRKECVHL